LLFLLSFWYRNYFRYCFLPIFVFLFGLQESLFEGLLAIRGASFTILNLNSISFTASNIYLLLSAVFIGFLFFLLNLILPLPFRNNIPAQLFPERQADPIAGREESKGQEPSPVRLSQPSAQS
jgi:hypothetical protein